MQSEYCHQCFTPLEEWEWRICEGCGMSEKPARGRPATERGAYNPNPARQFGRISDKDWNELKAAADAAGLSMVEWALPALLKKACRERGKAK
jgi:hypothetical protein